MTDLVDRLREQARKHESPHHTHWLEMIDAAEEIERLREALEDAARKIEARSEIYTSEEQMCDAIIAHCRAALASKP